MFRILLFLINCILYNFNMIISNVEVVSNKYTIRPNYLDLIPWLVAYKANHIVVNMINASSHDEEWAYIGFMTSDDLNIYPCYASTCIVWAMWRVYVINPKRATILNFW